MSSGISLGKCGVCLNPYTNNEQPAVLWPCAHTIHLVCCEMIQAKAVEKMQEALCPICRAPIQAKKINFGLLNCLSVDPADKEEKSEKEQKNPESKVKVIAYALHNLAVLKKENFEKDVDGLLDLILQAIEKARGNNPINDTVTVTHKYSQLDKRVLEVLDQLKNLGIAAGTPFKDSISITLPSLPKA